MIVYMLVFSLLSLSAIAIDDLDIGRKSAGVSDTQRKSLK
jgi:hypothetical protein